MELFLVFAALFFADFARSMIKLWLLIVTRSKEVDWTYCYTLNPHWKDTLTIKRDSKR